MNLYYLEAYDPFHQVETFTLNVHFPSALEAGPSDGGDDGEGALELPCTVQPEQQCLRDSRCCLRDTEAPSLHFNSTNQKSLYNSLSFAPMADSSGDVWKPPQLPLRSTASSHDLPSPPIRSSMASSGALSHRSSFAENLRSHPPSPRSARHPSFPQAAVQELLNHPPATKAGNPKFAGRDWRQIRVGELVSKDNVRFVELETGVEEATKVQITFLR